MNDRDRREAGLLYDVFLTGDDSWQKARKILKEVNNCLDGKEADPYLRELLGSMGNSCNIVPPFHCDLGSGIFLGENVFINMDCLFLDEGKITIGDRSMIGPRVSILTPVHPMDPTMRNCGLEACKPVSIGKDVWVGGASVINAGVNIGDGSVIGSGSVVTRDIPDHVFAAGNPCRIIRKLTEEDYRRDFAAVEEYKDDDDTPHVTSDWKMLFEKGKA